MKKDKELLKEAIQDYFRDEYASGDLDLEKAKTYLKDIVEMIDSVDFPERDQVVIPDFVAEWYEKEGKHSHDFSDFVDEATVCDIETAFYPIPIRNRLAKEWLVDHQELLSDIWYKGFKIGGEEVKEQQPVLKTEPIIDPHQTLLNELHQTYLAKNSDYGNSFSNSIREFGMVAAATRIDDKNSRIKQLVKKGEQKVVDESLRDTLLDMANYCVMAVMEMEE